MSYYINYYEIQDPGCCLICEEGYPGCLCYSCKCSKCSEYSGNGLRTYEFNDEGKRYCKLVEGWRNNYEWGQEGSDYCLNEIINETEKAIRCTLKKGKVISNTVLWIPRSVLTNDFYVKNWFVEKECIKSQFNEGVEAQKRLF